MFFQRSLRPLVHLKKTGEVELQCIDGGIIIVILRRGVKCTVVVDVCCMCEWKIYCMLGIYRSLCLCVCLPLHRE